MCFDCYLSNRLFCHLWHISISYTSSGCELYPLHPHHCSILYTHVHIPLMRVPCSKSEQPEVGSIRPEVGGNQLPILYYFIIILMNIRENEAIM